VDSSSRAFRIALSAAAFLARSRKVTLFAALVAAAGLVRELSQRASETDQSDTSAEIPAGSS
jgi:hypothetical protein